MVYVKVFLDQHILKKQFYFMHWDILVNFCRNL